MHRFRFIVATGAVEDGAKSREVTRHVGMAGSQGIRSDGQASASDGFGEAVPTAGVLEARHVVVEDRDEGMGRMEFPRKVESTAVGAAAVRQPALVLVDDPQTVQEPDPQRDIATTDTPEKGNALPDAALGPRIPPGETITVSSNAAPQGAQDE